MTLDKPDRSPIEKGEPLRQRILAAAERLLRDGKAEFSMRELATAAGVSFATPFNRFGNKAAIMHALSAHRIETMTTRFGDMPNPRDTSSRVTLAVTIAVEVMLEEPAVNRSVMGWIGTPGPATGEALACSSAFWALALGDGASIAEKHREKALRELPRQLALGFRGALSFWSAGELCDEALGRAALDVACSLLRGHAGTLTPADAPARRG